LTSCVTIKKFKLTTILLADCLNVPLAAVRIASGERNRLKRVEIRGAKPEQFRAIASAGSTKNKPGAE
jgi:uncharacterized protein YggU (UPF0235/DUF167 family)